MDKSDIPDLFKKQREISKRGLSAQYENTESCYSFYNADQMSYADRIQYEDSFGRKQRALVNFNKVQQNVDSVVGFMAQNRRQAKYIAHLNQNQGQQLYSKNMNALYDFHRENTNADQLETEQDLDMMIAGYGAVDSDLSYIIGNATQMPNGEIIKDKLDATCTYWDPNAKKGNLLDARWAGYWKDYELKDAVELFQGSVEEDFEEVSVEEPSNAGYIFNPYGGIYDKIKMDSTVEWTSKEAEMVRVYNHQWMKYETFYKAENPLYTAETPEDAMFLKLKLDAIKAQIELPGDTIEEDVFAFDPTAEELTFDTKTLGLFKKEFGKAIEAIPFKRKVYYTAVVSGTHVFTWFKSVSQQGFSIKFKTGTWNRNRKVWMGMVNSMMEPSKYYNKALTELMFTIASNSKGGVMVERDAVEDVADFETKWAKTDAVIVVESGALAAGKVQEKTKGALSTGLEGIITLCDQNISANGVDPSFLGDISKEDQSGLLFKRRIKQVIAKFARYMDSITLAQKEDARLMADLIPVWVQNNKGAMIRITGEDGADEFIRLTEDMLCPEYDISIQEASQSTDQKQETAIMLSGYADKFLAVQDMATGKALLGESLQYMPIDGDTRNKLMQILQPQDQIDPAQFQQLQLENQQLKQIIQSAQVDKTKSETEKNLATAAKTMKEANVSVADVPLRHAQTIKALADAGRAHEQTQKANEEIDHLKVDGIHKVINGPQTGEQA